MQYNVTSANSLNSYERHVILSSWCVLFEMDLYWRYTQPWLPWSPRFVSHTCKYTRDAYASEV